MDERKIYPGLLTVQSNVYFLYLCHTNYGANVYAIEYYEGVIILKSYYNQLYDGEEILA